MFVFEAHEGALACNNQAFVKVGGCGVGVHQLNPALLLGLKQQMLPAHSPTGYRPTIAQTGLQLERRNLSGSTRHNTVPSPTFQDFHKEESGLTLELWVDTSQLDDSSGGGRELIDCRGQTGIGLALLLRVRFQIIRNA